MPTYEYRCRDCGHTFDIVQKMSDASLTHCPECGGELRKVFAPPAIAFKGSGFYATDHGKKSRSSSDADKDKKESGTKSGDSKSEGTKDGDSKDRSSKDGSTETKKSETKDTGSGSSSSSSTTKKEESSS